MDGTRQQLVSFPFFSPFRHLFFDTVLLPLFLMLIVSFFISHVKNVMLVSGIMFCEREDGL